LQTNKNFSPLQFFKNIFSNGLLFLINTVISFWLTPYLKNKIGLEIYGLIPLITSATSYLGIITQSLNNSVARFLTIEIEKNDIEKANRVFNTAFWGTLALVLMASPFGIILIYFAPVVFDIPAGQEVNTQILLAGTILSFLIISINSNFTVAAFSRNRFDLGNIVDVLARLINVGVVVAVFALFTPSLIGVTIGALVGVFFTIGGDYYLWKKLLPKLHIHIEFFTRSLMRKILGTSIWLLISRVGALLFLSIEMIVANKVLSLEMAGMYGAILTAPANLRTMASIISGVWGPSFLAKYSRKDFSGLESSVKSSIKMIGLVMALPVGFLIGVSRPFLIAWLGPEFSGMSSVLIMMIAHLSINLSISPLFSIHLSLNKVRIPALVTLGLGILNVIMLFLFSRIYGAMGLAMAGAIALSAKNILFTPIYTAYILKKQWWLFYHDLIPNIIWTIIVALVSWMFVLIFPSNSILVILLAGMCISILYVIAGYAFWLNPAEKAVMLNIFKQKN
jgi:O-antigen/teichoic acid export membrane protein